MSEFQVKSGIYEGLVSHCRFSPRMHRFCYRVFMLYLDLTELDQIFAKSPFWSLEGVNLASFRRQDYLGDPAIPLDQAVRHRIAEETGSPPTGPIRMLTNIRYFGYIINPITCYYCFDEEEQLQWIVAEVTNTPWQERHSYVIPAASQNNRTDTGFAKSHHVSPFMPMTMDYLWRSTVPGQYIDLYMENHQQGERVFNAKLHLNYRPVTRLAMNMFLLKYPFMTLKVAWGIYWQALKLWGKGIGFHPNPKRRKSSTVVTPSSAQGAKNKL